MAFKSVAYQETLEAAGIPEAQAKAQAMEEFVVNELVTKEYLEHKLSDLKFELVKWIVGTVGAVGLTLLVAILRLGRI
jgi:hypothetical protein